MAKGLFLSLPLTGHVNPSLGLVHELARRGDDVAYYATDGFAEAIERAGAHFRQYSAAPLADLRHLPERTNELSSWLVETAGRVLEADLAAFRALRPDYVITDSVAPWGQWAAAILGVPLVTSISTIAFNHHVMRYAFGRGVRPRHAWRLATKLRHVGRAWWLRRRLARRYGVAGPGVFGAVMGSSDLNIVYTSRRFQPCAETFDSRFQFIGPLVQRSETTFAWDRLRPSAEVIYVSLGTLFNRNVAFYRACVEAFADGPEQVVVSTGSTAAVAELGQLPANIIAAAYVPQLAVLQRAAAFVTHGGMNSVSESLSCAVPMVVVPQMSEQAIVGRRVEELGAGLYLAAESVTAATLRSAVRRLQAEDRFRTAAAEIRQSFRDAGGAARAADAIHRFLAVPAS
jgi:MGT family glycosyltransferase